jgi:ribosomal protein S18 acetylase RimI-like enzyme
MMNLFKIEHSSDCPKGITIEQVVDFLYKHLDEFGDDRESIRLCIEHAFGATGLSGGFLLLAMEDDQLIGALVMNRTGMTRYIPENALVYVAVHREYRGRGIGATLIRNAIQQADGDMKLHVEYQNPAKRLYERLGFSSKYAEMRYIKGS